MDTLSRTDRIRSVIKKQIKIFNSTTIGLFKDILKCTGRIPKDGRRKEGIKVHTVIEVDAKVPKLVWFSSAATHDHILLDKLGPGLIYVFDNGKSETLSRISENAIFETSSRNFDLSWSHYLKLMRIDDENERKFHEIEAYKNNWSVRELQRQFDSALYTRLALSRNKDKVKELSIKELVLEKPKDAISLFRSA